MTIVVVVVAAVVILPWFSWVWTSSKIKGKPKRCLIIHRSYDYYHPSLIQSFFLRMMMTIKIMILIMIMMKMILLFPRMIYLELQLFFVATLIQVKESRIESNEKKHSVTTANKTEAVFLLQPYIGETLCYIQVHWIFLYNLRTLIKIILCTT